MKRITRYILCLIAVIVAASVFTACGDDNEDNANMIFLKDIGFHRSELFDVEQAVAEAIDVETSQMYVMDTWNGILMDSNGYIQNFIVTLAVKKDDGYYYSQLHLRREHDMMSVSHLYGRNEDGSADKEMNVNCIPLHQFLSFIKSVKLGEIHYSHYYSIYNHQTCILNSNNVKEYHYYAGNRFVINPENTQMNVGSMMMRMKFQVEFNYPVYAGDLERTQRLDGDDSFSDEQWELYDSTIVLMPVENCFGFNKAFMPVWTPTEPESETPTDQ